MSWVIPPWRCTLGSGAADSPDAIAAWRSSISFRASRSGELLITLAGPAVNFIIAAGLYLIVRLPQGWPLEISIIRARRRVSPVADHLEPGDGMLQLSCPFSRWTAAGFSGRCSPRRMSYLRATRWAVTVGKVLAVAAGAGGGLWDFTAISAGVLFGFIYLAGDNEYRALLRREREDASPPGLFPRPPTAPVEEPPILTPRIGVGGEGQAGGDGAHMAALNHPAQRARACGNVG